MPDGSIMWSRVHQALFTQKRAKQEALAFAMLRRDDPPNVDQKGVDAMDSLLKFLVHRGVKVFLAHPPFNPVFFDAVRGTRYMDGLEKVKKLTREFAQKYELQIIGNFDPYKVGCSADMYIDAEHSNPECLGLILNQYRMLESVSADFKR